MYISNIDEFEGEKLERANANSLSHSLSLSLAPLPLSLFLSLSVQWHGKPNNDWQFARGRGWGESFDQT